MPEMSAVPYALGNPARPLPISASADAGARIPRAERVAAGLLIAAALVLRWLAVLRHVVNSDEPQHLHVAWAWTQGLLPYRDVFDNHSPLFSLLMSVPLRALGERPEVVVLMRLWMLPFSLGSLALVAFIARRLFGARTALWSVAILGLDPVFLAGSVEYRTDVAWGCAWLGVLAVLVAGQLSRRRAFAAGVLAGIAMTISMKTSLLVTTTAAAAGMTWLASRRGERSSPASIAPLLGAAAAGFVLAPLAAIALFWRLGALEPMIRCLVGYNVVPGLGLWGSAPLRPLGLVAGAPILVALAVWTLRRAPDPAVGRRRAVVLASTGFAHLAIETVWPLVVHGDLMPLLPVEAIFAAALLVAATSRIPVGPNRAVRALLSPAVLVAVGLGGLIATIWVGDFGRNGTCAQRRCQAEVLHLTGPGDVVMSLKGEAVFRRRPIYPAIETIAEERYRRGELVDDIPERLAATETPVVVQYDVAPYPPRAWAFMRDNYLPVDFMRVLGQYVDPPATGAGERTFFIAVPQEYTMIGPRGPARGVLDGEPWRGPRRLGRGFHRYVAAPVEGRLAVVWAPAIARGYAPALVPGPPLAPRAGDRLLVLAPHPDDETVSNAGLILAAKAAGAAVKIVWATDGENNPWAQLAHEGRWPVSAADRARWAALRRGESRAALRALGASDAEETWLALPDGGLTRQWMSGDERLADSIAAAIRQFHPTIVSAPSLFDSHPDHSLMALATDIALARLAPGESKPKLIAYRAHKTDIVPEPSLTLSLTPTERAAKMRAFECFSSQLHWRRRQFVALADSVERFEPPDTVAAALQMHRVRGAWIDGDRLVVDFVAGRWPSLGPLALRVSCDGANGPLARLAVPLPTHGVATHASSGTTRITKMGDGWRVELPLALASTPLHCYVKIERPAELACGFFDESGWWLVGPGKPAGDAPRDGRVTAWIK